MDLAELARLAGERRRLTERVAEVDEAIRVQVRAAFDAGASIEDMMAATELGRARLYQIRKGTRR